MRRPLIAVTTTARWTPSWPFIWLSIRLAGGRALRIRPGEEARARGADALLIGGGDDIGTELYGGEALLDVKLDPERDATELRLLRDLWDGPTPIFGICRGAQMMNVACGGTLHEDIHEIYKGAFRGRTPFPVKTVRIRPGARLHEVTGVVMLKVNSIHHQSVDRLGDGLAISARDESGVVQAIEAKARADRIGVQWHPEFLIYRKAHLGFFRALVRAAAALRDGEALDAVTA